MLRFGGDVWTPGIWMGNKCSYFWTKLDYVGQMYSLPFILNLVTGQGRVAWNEDLISKHVLRNIIFENSLYIYIYISVYPIRLILRNPKKQSLPKLCCVITFAENTQI